MVGIGAGFRDWRRILQVTSVLHIATPLLAQYFPESPKWLLAKNDISKISELKTVLKYAANVNGKYNEDSEKKIEALLSTKEHSKLDINTKDRFIDTLRYVLHALTFEPKTILKIISIEMNITCN